MNTPIVPTGLTVDLLRRPLGVPAEGMTFSYQLPPIPDAVTASDFAFYSGAEETPLLTLTAAGSASCGISLPALSGKLLPDHEYAVRVRAHFGEACSDWSEPVSVVTAPETFDPPFVWHANCPDFCLFRRPFELTETPHRVLLQITAFSPEPVRQYVYQASCNGTFVGLGPTRLGAEDTGTVLYYDTLDVTPYLKVGSNVIAAACYTTGEHGLAARLVAYDRQGNAALLWQDGWQAMDATAVFRPADSIGTNYFFAAAENIDGAIYPYGYDLPENEGNGFVPAQKAVLPAFTTAPYPAPPVGRVECPAEEREAAEETVRLYDLIREIIGGVHLTLTCPEDRELTLCFGEELNEDGTVRYKMRTTNVYRETWHFPAGTHTLGSIGMKTFRYFSVEGLEPADELTVTGLAYRTEFADAESCFTSSSELLNAVYDMCKYTICATNQNLYVDSQSRERCAYEGDVLINMLTAYGVEWNPALARFSVDYLTGHRTWPAEYLLFHGITAWEDYQHTGDTALLCSRYQRLKNAWHPASADPATGLFRRPSDAPNGMDAVLVDWPMSERDGYAYDECTYNTVYNALAVKALNCLADLAQALEAEQEAHMYRQLAQKTKAAMNRLLWDAKAGCYRDGLTEDGTPVDHASQHATAFALYADIPEPAQQPAAVQALASRGGIYMSVYGAFFLLEGLYTAGGGRVANALLLNDDVTPGARTYAYMLDKLDATIATEAWNPQNKGNMTFSHPWGSAAGAELVRGIMGIRPAAPGFAEFSFAPVTDGLRYAAIQVPTVKGKILASFDTTHGFTATLTVPGNSRAQVSLPAPENAELLINDRPVKTRRQGDRLTTVQSLPGGRYTLTFSAE